MEKRFDVRLLKLQCGDCAQLLSDFVWRTATNLHHEKYKVAASATNQYSRHAACENGQLGGDQGTAPASARPGNRHGQRATREWDWLARDQRTGMASARYGNRNWPARDRGTEMARLRLGDRNCQAGVRERT